MTAIDVNVIVTGADIFANELRLTTATLGTAEARIVAHYGMVYMTRVKGRMSGRPGLRAITGDARRRVRMEVRRLPNGASAANVYTNWVAARRHEFGFTGPDSLGRHISTPPRPAWQPDLQRTADEMSAAFLAAVRIA